MGRRTLQIIWLGGLGALLSPAAMALPTLLAEHIADVGDDQPVQMLTTPDDDGRLFIVCRTGRVHIVDETGFFRPSPFFRDTSIAAPAFSGLLGMAFHPKYEENGYFYLYYIAADNVARIVRYSVSEHPDIADESTAFPVLSFTDAVFDTHFGGWLEFGPDGYLYLSVGDADLTGADQFNRSQDLAQLMGKILRLDVDVDDFPMDPDQNYGAPASNPLAGNMAGQREEIWAYGLRNPWRCDFDAQTGDLYVADVGESSWEEVNLIPAGAPPLPNFGWRCREGWVCTPFAAASCAQCPDSSLTDPVYAYSHGGEACSIIGGAVYRGSSLPLEYQGRFFFSDYCTGAISSLDPAVQGPTRVVDHSSTLKKAISPLTTSVNTGPGGEVYFCNRLGDVWKLAPDPSFTTCEWDLIADGVVGASDLATLISLWNAPYVSDDLAALIGSWGPCP